jgi:hypothetical protein
VETIISCSCRHHHGDGIFLAVTKTDCPAGESQGFRYKACPPVQDKVWFSAALMQCLHLPPPYRTDSRSQGFDCGFLRGEPDGESSRPASTFFHFRRSEDALQEAVSMAIEGCLDAWNFNDIYTGFHLHGIHLAKNLVLSLIFTILLSQ